MKDIKKEIFSINNTSRGIIYGRWQLKSFPQRNPVKCVHFDEKLYPEILFIYFEVEGRGRGMEYDLILVEICAFASRETLKILCKTPTTCSYAIF